MAFFEDLFKVNAVTGVAVGVGALLLAPGLVPAVGRVLRPAAKAVIKGGLVLYRETVSEIGEVASDLFAEARAELEQGNSHTVTTTASERGRGARTEGH
jgi:hypothetical protein